MSAEDDLDAIQRDLKVIDKALRQMPTKLEFVLIVGGIVVAVAALSTAIGFLT